LNGVQKVVGSNPTSPTYYLQEGRMNYDGQEKRKHPRARGRFVVHYRVLEEQNNIDITQTKDLSLGGMYLTTNRKFDPGTKLALEIRLPFDPDPIMIVGRVVDSRVIAHDLIYDTRIEFLQIDKKHINIIGQTIDYYLKKKV
jgi:PilZ domain